MHNLFVCKVLNSIILSWLSLVFFSFLQAYLFCGDGGKQFPYLCTDAILNPPGSFVFTWASETSRDVYGYDLSIVFNVCTLSLFVVLLFIQDIKGMCHTVGKMRQQRLEYQVVLSCKKSVLLSQTKEPQ